MKLLLAVTLLFSGNAFSQATGCGVTREVDKFTGVVRWFSDYNPPLMFQKSKTKTYTRTYLHLTIQDGVLATRIKGVYVLLTNGLKISRPAEPINVEVNDEGTYTYSAMITLLPADLKALSENEITDYRLYIFDSTLTPDVAEFYKKAAGCIAAAK